MLGRVQRALAGRLRGLRTPADLAAQLPAAGSGPPAIGTSSAGPEAWAIWDTSRDPRGVLARLRNGGLTQLGARMFWARGADHVLTATVFPFASEEAAQAWQAEDVPGPADTPLEPGATGPHSTFLHHDKLYEIQFAAKSVVGDVACEGVAGEAPTSCEAETRALAERWYAQLGG